MQLLLFLHAIQLPPCGAAGRDSPRRAAVPSLTTGQERSWWRGGDDSPVHAAPWPPHSSQELSHRYLLAGFEFRIYSSLYGGRFYIAPPCVQGGLVGRLIPWDGGFTLLIPMGSGLTLLPMASSGWVAFLLSPPLSSMS